MKKEIRSLWTDALRSREYLQSQSELSGGETYCCLGVLCELSGMGYDGESCWVPDKIAKWAGLPVHEKGDDDVQRALAEMNDAGNTFDVIADFIEERL